MKPSDRDKNVRVDPRLDTEGSEEGPFSELYRREIAPLVEQLLDKAKALDIPVHFCAALELREDLGGLAVRTASSCGRRNENGDVADKRRVGIIERLLSVTEQGFVPIPPDMAAQVVLQAKLGEMLSGGLTCDDPDCEHCKAAQQNESAEEKALREAATAKKEGRIQ